MNRIAISLAMLAILGFAGTTMGQKPQRPGGPQRPGVGKDGKEAGQARRMQQDPKQMVARMMQQFDKDGDQKLDVRELTELLIAMRDRRGGNAGPAGIQGRPGMQRNGQRQGARQGGRQPGGDAAKPGGDRPKRPKADDV